MTVVGGNKMKGKKMVKIIIISLLLLFQLITTQENDKKLPVSFESKIYINYTTPWKFCQV